MIQTRRDLNIWNTLADPIALRNSIHPAPHSKAAKSCSNPGAFLKSAHLRGPHGIHIPAELSSHYVDAPSPDQPTTPSDRGPTTEFTRCPPSSQAAPNTSIRQPKIWPAIKLWQLQKLARATTNLHRHSRSRLSRRRRILQRSSNAHLWAGKRLQHI